MSARLACRWQRGEAGEQVWDSGALVCSSGGGPLDRTERFEMIDRPDGGFSILSVSTSAHGFFTVESRVDYDAAGRPMRASGANDKGMVVEMTAVPPHADLKVTRADGSVEEDRLDFPEGWQMDLEPSALPMWMMTRLYDRARGGRQEFHWIGRSTTEDRVLRDGVTSFWHQARLEHQGLVIDHWMFDEDLPGSPPIDFDMWTDAEGRMLRFMVAANFGERSFRVNGVRDDAKGALIADLPGGRD